MSWDAPGLNVAASDLCMDLFRTEKSRQCDPLKVQAYLDLRQNLILKTEDTLQHPYIPLEQGQKVLRYPAYFTTGVNSLISAAVAP